MTKPKPSCREALQGVTYGSLGADGGKTRYLYFVVAARGAEFSVGFWNSGSQAKDKENTVRAIEAHITEIEATFNIKISSVVLDNEPKNCIFVGVYTLLVAFKYQQPWPWRGRGRAAVAVAWPCHLFMQQNVRTRCTVMWVTDEYRPAKKTVDDRLAVGRACSQQGAVQTCLILQSLDFPTFRVFDFS